MIALSNRTAVIVITLMFLALPPAKSEVRVDVSAKEVDEIKGTLRVRDLVVNDSARVYAGSLCIRDNKLFLPDSTELQDNAVDEWGVDLKIKVLPDATVTADAILPTTDDKERMRNSIESVLSSNLRPSFTGKSPYCDERQSVDETGTRVRYLEIESINGLHSIREVYEQLLQDAGLK